MGFNDSMSNMINALSTSAANANNLANKNRAVDLANHLQGYDLHNGKLVANEYGKATEDNRLKQARVLAQQLELQETNISNSQMYADAQTEALKQAIEDTQQQLHIQQSVQNTKDMTSALIKAIQGKHEDAKSIIDTNPILKDTLSNMGVTDIASVDWQKDRDLYAHIPNFNVTEEYMKQPAVVNALNSAYMKIRGADGKWKLVSTEALFNETNTPAYMTKTDKDWLYNRVNKMKEILNGKVILSDTQVKEKQDIYNLATKYCGGNKPSVACFKMAKEDLYKKNNPEVIHRVAESYGVDANSVTMDMINKWGANVAKKQNLEDKTKHQVDVIKAKEGIKDAHKTKEIDTIVDASKVVPKYVDALAEGKELDSNDFNTLKQAAALQDKQAATKAKKSADLMYGEVKALGQLNSALDTVNDLKKAKVELGAITNAKMWLKSHLPSGVVGDLSEDNKKIIESGTKTGIMLAMFIKSMSGAQVSDKEREMYLNIIGGKWDNIQSLKAKLDAFKDTLKDGIKASVGNVGAAGDYKTLIEVHPLLTKVLGDVSTKDNTTVTNIKPIEVKSSEGTPIKIDVSKYIKG